MLPFVGENALDACENPHFTCQMQQRIRRESVVIQKKRLVAYDRAKLLG